MQGKTQQEERQQLMLQIQNRREGVEQLERKLQQYRDRWSKIKESNERNQKRLLKVKARTQELRKYQEQPEYALHISGYMNEEIQAYILSQNYVMQNINHLDPDHMSYEQLVELGEQIGKVSKGLSVEELSELRRERVKKEDESCPICYSTYVLGEMIINLDCRHTYHQKCIKDWFKNQSNCPLCKAPVGRRSTNLIIE